MNQVLFILGTMSPVIIGCLLIMLAFYKLW